MNLKPDYCGALAYDARTALGLTQKEMADSFGMSLNAWQKKEQNENRCSVAEQYYFLLILDDNNSNYLACEQEYIELAGRMYEATDIQRAIETRQFTTVEQILEAVKNRAEACSKEMDSRKKNVSFTGLMDKMPLLNMNLVKRYCKL